MNAIANRLLMFASAVVIGTTAYGQTMMKAEIPFEFRTGNTSLPAGTYTVGRIPSPGMHGVIKLGNTVSNRTVYALSEGADDSRKADGKPSMSFACGKQGCSIREIRGRDYAYAFPIPHKKTRDGGTLSFVTVPLRPLNAD